MSRAVVLEKIRRACAASVTAGLPDELPEFPSYEDAASKFRDELEATGGVFFDARSSDELPEILSQILERTGTTEFYWESEEVFQKSAIPYRLRDPEAFSRPHLVFSYHFKGKVEFPLVLNFKPYDRATLAAVPVSVSRAPYGIAETGTIVHSVTPGTGRLLSVLPEAHVVLLSEKNLLMNSVEFLDRTQLGELGSALTLVTGPSRTADIEKTLVLGVHGPRQWYVVLTS